MEKIVKVVGWDVANHMEKKEYLNIPSNEVAFIVNETTRYVISIDKVTGGLRLYKSGFSDDRMVLTVQSSNIIIIE